MAAMTLRWRLGLTVAVAVIGAMVWYSALITANLKPRYWQAMEETLVDTAEVLAAQIAEDSHGDAPFTATMAATFQTVLHRTLDARIYELHKTSVDLHICITDSHGIVCYDSADPTAVGRDDSRWNDVYLTLRGKYGARATRRDPKDDRSTVLHVAAPIRRGSQVLGVVSVSKPIDAITPAVQAHTDGLFLGAILVTLIVGLLSVLATIWITAPLTKLTNFVRQITQGKRPNLPRLGPKEIAVLGQVIQDMRERLEGRAYAERYVQDLTHELKSPLTGIRAAAELLEEDLPLAERERFLRNLRGECERLHSIVERLLSLSSLERRDTLEHREIIDLDALLQTVIADYQSRMVERSLTLTVEMQPATTQGDAFLLRQAIGNLLQNAIEFSPLGGQIHLTLSIDGSQACINIDDHGPGVPPYAQERLFERFFSLPRPDTGKKGTGLGLALVREVARLHQGSADLSQREGGGTTAWIRVAMAGI